MKQGLVHINCGEGKGKTSAAIGLAVRAAGSGKKVLFVQFLKGSSSGEVLILESLTNVTVVRAQEIKKFAWDMSDEEKTLVSNGNNDVLEKVFEQAAADDCDVLILDEALGACSAQLLDEEKLLKLVQQRPATLEVVLTGREPSQELLALADYVTEMQKVKHPFDNGVSARRGIEF